MTLVAYGLNVTPLASFRNGAPFLYLPALFVSLQNCHCLTRHKTQRVVIKICSLREDYEKGVRVDNVLTLSTRQGVDFVSEGTFTMF